MATNWNNVTKGIDESKPDIPSRISSLTHFTDKEISSLFPDVDGQKNLAELMATVKKASGENAKQKAIIDNVTKFAKTIVTIIDKVV